jgi:hypothetical protein
MKVYSHFIKHVLKSCFGKLKSIKFQGDVWVNFSWEMIRDFGRTKRPRSIYSTVANKSMGDLKKM